jgi:hypothetical protein
MFSDFQPQAEQHKTRYTTFAHCYTGINHAEVVKSGTVFLAGCRRL